MEALLSGGVPELQTNTGPTDKDSLAHEVDSNRRLILTIETPVLEPRDQGRLTRRLVPYKSDLELRQGHQQRQKPFCVACILSCSMFPQGKVKLRPPFSSHAHRIVSEASFHPKPTEYPNGDAQSLDPVRLDRELWHSRLIDESDPLIYPPIDAHSPRQPSKLVHAAPPPQQPLLDRAVVVSDDPELPILKYTFPLPRRHAPVWVDAMGDPLHFVIHTQQDERRIFKPELPISDVLWHSVVNTESGDFCTVTLLAFL